MQAATAISSLSRASIVLLASSLAWAAGPQQTSSDPKAQDPQQVIKKWPDSSKKAARNMIEKYGQPDGVTENHLVWLDNGPWVRTIVHKKEVQHNFPKPHKDVLEQYINYEVPEEKFSELAKYDGSVVAFRTNGELSARCDKEAANFLALNLANDVIEGRRTVDEARAFYARTIQQMMQGEKPEYTQSFQFQTRMASATADPDEQFDMQAAAQAETGSEASSATQSRRAESDEPVESAELSGMTVVSADGEEIGEVAEVTVETGKDDMARIALNEGFLGVGETEVILPVDDLTRTPEGKLRTDLTRAEIDSMKRPVSGAFGERTE